MSKSNNLERKPYTKITTLLMIFISVVSLLSAFIIYFSNSTAKRYTEQSEYYNNLAILASNDIQGILLDDSAKYQIAYNLLQELLILNDQIIVMKTYNETMNYSQTDYDSIGIEFAVKMETLIDVVQDTHVYQYSAMLGATVDNDYTYGKWNYFLFYNTWKVDSADFDNIIKYWVNETFFFKSKTAELPEIKMEVWNQELHMNLSVITKLNYSSQMNSFISEEINLVNQSLVKIVTFGDGYSELAGVTYQNVDTFTTALIAFTLAAIILSVVFSLDVKKDRMVCLITGFILVICSAFIFLQATLNLIRTGGEAQLLFEILNPT